MMSAFQSDLAAKSRLALDGEEGFVPMSPEEEGALGRRVQAGDQEAAWTLVMANQNFVRSIARRYRREGIELEDLVGEGLVGLLDAALRFDPDRGIKFITYGVWWVKRSILRHLRSFEHDVHVPKYKQYAMQELGRTQRLLQAELGRLPDSAELMAVTGCTEREIAEFHALSGARESLDDDQGRVLESLAGTEPDAESLAILSSCRRRLAAVMVVLDERERLVVAGRYGLDGSPRRTLAAIGDDLGLTKERIRQLERLACRKLLAAMNDVDFSAAPALEEPQENASLATLAELATLAA